MLRLRNTTDVNTQYKDMEPTILHEALHSVNRECQHAPSPTESNMHDIPVTKSTQKGVDYDVLHMQMKALMDPSLPLVSNLSNLYVR